jgi:hypothetical protein
MTSYGCAPEKKAHLVSLMLLNLLPQASVGLDANLLGGVELVETAQVHVLGQQRDHVLVEGLPVRVLEVVPNGRVRNCGFCIIGRGERICSTHFWLPSFS